MTSLHVSSPSRDAHEVELPSFVELVGFDSDYFDHLGR
jgi:hypothetical protein